MFDPNHIILTAGATSANETLMFCLAESGDVFLLPTPYYLKNKLNKYYLYVATHPNVGLCFYST